MAGLVELLVAELRANPAAAQALAAELAEFAPGMLEVGEPEPLLTVRQAASRAQVSERTIRRRIDRGELPVIRVGTSVRIEGEALALFLTHTTSRPDQSRSSERRRRVRRSGAVAEAFRRLDSDSVC